MREPSNEARSLHATMLAESRKVTMINARLLLGTVPESSQVEMHVAFQLPREKTASGVSTPR